jgi:predicted nuclease of predicted toxin-antitoxin system
MKFMADENFPGPAVVLLREAGFDVAWITEDASGVSDNEVLALCSASERILLTLDKDFGELAFHRRLPAKCGIVLFRVRFQNPNEVASIACAALASYREWAGRFSVITRLGIRVRPLAAKPSG